MKNTLLYVSDASIFIFLIMWVLDVVIEVEGYDEVFEFKNLFVVIFLVTNLGYHKIVVKEQKSIIQELKLKNKNK